MKSATPRASRARDLAEVLRGVVTRADGPALRATSRSNDAFPRRMPSWRTCWHGSWAISKLRARLMERCGARNGGADANPPRVSTARRRASHVRRQRRDLLSPQARDAASTLLGEGGATDSRGRANGAHRLRNEIRAHAAAKNDLTGRFAIDHSSCATSARRLKWVQGAI